MEFTTIQALHLLHKISQHKEWIRTFNTNTLSGERLTLTDVSISDIAVSHENLTGVLFSRCHFSHVFFDTCDVSDSLFINSAFSNCSFINCSLVKSDFNGSHCDGVDFTGSDLTRADFTNTSLVHANFTRCNLGWAWFMNSDMRYAVLDNVELTGTRFSEAKMYNDKRYVLKPVKSITAKDIDISMNGDGTNIVGVDFLDYISQSISDE